MVSVFLKELMNWWHFLVTLETNEKVIVWRRNKTPNVKCWLARVAMAMGTLSMWRKSWHYSHGSSGDGRAPEDVAHRSGFSDVYFPWLWELISWWKEANAGPSFHRAVAVKMCAGSCRRRSPRSNAHRETLALFYYNFCSFSSIIHINVAYCKNETAVNFSKTKRGNWHPHTALLPD